LNNTFRNCSKSTMPGPIDVEPDANAFHIARNIHICDNRIESYSGGQGISVTTHNIALTSPLFGLKIKDNYITGATKAFGTAILCRTAETISSSTVPMGIEISGNEVIDSGSVLIQPFWAIGVRDCRIKNNTFRGGTAAALGDETDADVLSYDVDIENNMFYRNGNVSGAINISSTNNLRILRNTIDSPNAGASTIGLRFVGSGVTTVSDNVSIIGNTFIKGASQTISVGVSEHTLNPATNTSYGNRVVGGSLIDQFRASDLGDADITKEVVLVDDFVSRSLSSDWTGRVGTDGQCVTPTIVAIANGAVRLTAGDDAAASMAANGCQMEGNLNWAPNNLNLSIAFRVKVNAITDVCMFVGFTDQISALEMPVTLGASDALTSNATDATGVLFDTAADTDEWCLVGVASNVDATLQFAGVAPTAGTYETWRIDITNGEVATFSRNGTVVGTAMTGAVGNFVDLAPVVAVFSRTTATRLLDVDYIRIHQRR
ncbi:MAG: right-handed parallel beta-helix repeat-containing protein, partial [Bacteroidota bacterium]